MCALRDGTEHGHKSHLLTQGAHLNGQIHAKNVSNAVLSGYSCKPSSVM